MENHYSLRIWCKKVTNIPVLDNIFGVKSRSVGEWWIYEVSIYENDCPYDFINEFMDLLEGKYSQLEQMGIQREDIGIWHIHFYDENEECELVYKPEEMKRMGEDGVSLCISCA